MRERCGREHEREQCEGEQCESEQCESEQWEREQREREQCESERVRVRVSTLSTSRGRRVTGKQLEREYSEQ